MRKTFVAALGLFVFFPAGALAEPTLKQTVDYINNTFRSCGAIVSGPKRTTSGTTPYEWMQAVEATRIEVKDATLTMKQTIRTVHLVFAGSQRYDRDFHRRECRKSRGNIPKYAYGLMSGRDRGGCFFVGKHVTHTAMGSFSDLLVEVRNDEHGRLMIECAEGKQCMPLTEEGYRHHYKDGRERVRENYSTPGFALAPCRQKAGKLRKALSHLIKISGGKRELF